MVRLDAIGVVVSDLGRAVAFYRLLGLEFGADADSDDAGHLEAALSDGMRLMLDSEETVRSFNPAWAPATGGDGRSSLAFLCDSPAEVDRLHDELVAAGAASRKPPWDAFWGQRYAQLTDPDGNPIDLFAPSDH